MTPGLMVLTRAPRLPHRTASKGPHRNMVWTVWGLATRIVMYWSSRMSDYSRMKRPRRLASAAMLVACSVLLQDILMRRRICRRS